MIFLILNQGRTYAIEKFLQWKDTYADLKMRRMMLYLLRIWNGRYNVLESHGGVKGCNFIVAEVDMPSKATEATAAKSIEGISLLNNFIYEVSGIRCWKAYKTGKGKLINADPEQQRPASLKIIEAHDPNRSTTGTMMTAKSSSDKCSSLFYCE